jgi:hypothetical protein
VGVCQPRRGVLAVLYDIHGNLPALEEVLKEADAAGAESYLLGGDFAPWPRETIEPSSDRRQPGQRLSPFQKEDRAVHYPASGPDRAERAARDLVRVVRRIQTLTVEINELRRGERDTRELDARERELDDLRWRLAAVARRTAAHDRGAA